MTGGGEPALALSGVSVRFGEAQALRSIDFTLAPGAVAALVGESGSGKSTLLRLAMGLVAASAGTVAALGADPGTQPELRRRIGYVIQEGGLFPHLTAAANVALPATAEGWPQDRIHARIDELAALVGLTAAELGRRPAGLSGGQRQRVSLMRALMLEPELLLLDEPLGALDPVIRHGLQGELKALIERLGAAVVLVTHDLAEAAWFSDDLSVLRAGELVQRGTFRALRDTPATPYISSLLDAVRPLPA